ncbi:MAG: hypothetical protein ACI4RR_01895 [Eubacterium sp.]
MKNNYNNSSITKLPLDNAAKIYTAAMNKNWNSVFGVSVHLVRDVNILALKKAVKDLYYRFPSFYVSLKKEFFWDCFVPCTNTDIVEAEGSSPCKSFDISDKSKPLFRVVYSKREIRCEFFHSITDGTGANEYLKALIYQYLKNCRIELYGCDEIKTAKEHFKTEEIRDDFRENYEKGVRCSRADSNAYQVRLDKERDFLSRMQICLPIDEFSFIAKQRYNCTVTQLVSGIYALSLLKEYQKDGKSARPVKLSIPVNLRKFYGSNTLRNFSSYITVNVTPDAQYTLENVIALIKSQMTEKIKKESFTAMISQNIADEDMLISKYSPNFIKRIVMKAAFYLYGEMKYTSTVTNLGYITLPPDIQGEIEYFSVTLGETAINRINCAVAGYKNTLCVTLSSVSKNMDIQNSFMRILDENGLNFNLSRCCEIKQSNENECG